MDKKQVSLNFSINFSEIKDLNPNFALGKMRVAYVGDNRNGSSISKEVFEDAIPTMYNCPIVARYSRDTNSFGSHDIEVVINDNEIKVVNATQPIGVIPSGSDWYWETVVENDGVEHLYLVATVLLWKRQEAYEHLLEIGTVDESMECIFTDYFIDDRNILVAKKICFSAFCLLESAEPCYESASVQLFSETSKELFKQQFSQMIAELKEFTNQQPINFGFDINTNKGGNNILNFTEEIRDSILAKFKIQLSDLDFEITNEMTEDDFEKAVKEFAGGNNESETDDKKGIDEPEGEDNPESQSFSTTYKQKREALENALDPIIVKDGDKITSETHYWLADFNDEYVFVERYIWSIDDNQSDWGRFKYTFNDSDMTATTTSEFELMIVTWLTIEENQKLEDSRKMFAELLDFKNERLEADHKEDIDEVLSEFEDIKNTDEFSILKDKAYEFENMEDLKTKLFAIRGKQVKVNFEKNTKDSHIRVPIEPSEEEPYGGLFQIYKIN